MWAVEMLEELSTPVVALAAQWRLLHLKMNCVPAAFSPPPVRRVMMIR